MRLEEYWGVGPKTRSLLTDALGEDAAIEAIASDDIQALVSAGLSPGRATRILRHATDGTRLDVLATRDAHAVYREILEFACEYAVTDRAGDRIRVLTPLNSREAMRDRLSRVETAMETWNSLSADDRNTVLEIFTEYDSRAAGDVAAVETARELLSAGITTGVFDPLTELEEPVLAEAASALRGLENGDVADGVDDRLDRFRDQLEAARRLDRNQADVVESVRSGDVRATGEFREVLVEQLAADIDVEPERVRTAFPTDATDAMDFVSRTLRNLTESLESAVQNRRESVEADLRADLVDAEQEIEAATAAISSISMDLSLARFAIDFDMTRPEFVDGPTIAVENARNLGLLDSVESVQPVTYGLGAHNLSPPTERVSVLTGANSGGKTTLLETLCQVAVLAQMGLPVPADRAAVSPDLRIVFHRRHASFKAGVLESTLQSIVPPLTESGQTLMLVDEFEAITEPGSAADLLHGLVTLTVDGISDQEPHPSAIGAFVTHLATELEPLPQDARVDGISAQGLDSELTLQVDYQPRFHEVGRSTPEFIVSRLLADAADRRTRAAFETLAAAIGDQAVQQTLAAARWSE